MTREQAIKQAGKLQADIYDTFRRGLEIGKKLERERLINSPSKMDIYALKRGHSVYKNLEVK